MNKLLDEPHFSIKNLGSIDKGEFTHKPLTIFCGPNNSGKTWAMYSLYHYYHGLDSVLTTGLLNIDGEEKSNLLDLSNFNDFVSKTLHELFNAAPEQFSKARFELTNEQAWQRLIEATRRPDVFLMPAERNGLHLFFRELSTRRTALLHHASKENINIPELLHDVIRSRYAAPIAHYIDWLNSMENIQRRASGDFHAFAERLKKDLAGGGYKVDKNSGSIQFKPYQKKRDGKKTQYMGLHMTSSTVKSLFGLWFYLEYQALKGDLLMIDEPELNIHPDNQRKLARLLAQLVNHGLKIVISTHSDYIVREFNSLIMLNQDKGKTLRKKYKYQDDEILDPQKVGAYLFDEQTIRPFEITPEDGIYATTFDEVINKLNSVNDDIYYSLQENKGRSDHD